jgi:protein-S-isoprenylcysteine O-methyltransferase Ste14
VTPPYEQPGTNIVFWTLAGLFALGELVSRVRSGLRSGGRPVERWSVLVVVATVFAGFAGAFRLERWHAAAVGGGGLPLFVAGLVLMAAGLAVRQWSILVLGRFFTVDVRVHPEQTVVNRGPYRFVRHPSYSGMILFFAGLGLALDNWASLAVLALAPTAGLLVRIRSEERALVGALGDAYRGYAATRRRLFPGVW